MILEKRIPLKFWFNLIKWDIIFISVFSVGIFFFSEKYINFNIPISISGFLGTSIALLLSFKLSQSYDRWWEARKTWGSIVNDSRSLVLQLIKFVDPKLNQMIEKIALRQIAWCYSLTSTLRGQNDFTFLDQYISKEEFNSIQHHKNLPLAILIKHNEDLKAVFGKKSIGQFQYIQIDDTLTRLCDSMGKLERIKKTVFPKTYRMTLRFFIYLFLVILSFSLSDLNSWIEIPLLISIAIPFFLLEKISKNIQNPFENKPTDTPMSAISRTIEINIKQLIDYGDIPKEPEVTDFYLN